MRNNSRSRSLTRKSSRSSTTLGGFIDRSASAQGIARRDLKFESLEARLLLSVDLATRGDWVAQGPGPTLAGQVENILPDNDVVGAIHTVVTHPGDPDIVYVGGVNSGVWKTDNATAASPEWTPLTDDQPSLSIGALEFDPTDSTHQTLVAGVGRYSSFDPTGAPEGGYLTGLLRTTDGGQTWKVLDGGGTLLGKNISGVVARGGTIVVSVNTADDFNLANVGVFRSVDEGATFNQVSLGGTGLPGGASFDLAGDPNDPSILYTSIDNGGIYKSTDSGATWGQVSNAEINGLMAGGTNNVEISVGTSNNVYVGVVNNGEAAGFFRSGDGGGVWTAMGVPTTIEANGEVGLNPMGQGDIHFSILADPNDPDIVYVGGDRQPDFNEGADPAVFPNSIGAFDFSARLFRGDAAVDAANLWVHLTHSSMALPEGGGTASGSAPHANSREMAMDLVGNLIEVDDGGIYRRTNPLSDSGDWFSMNGDLQVTEIHDVAYDSISNIVMTGNVNTGTTEQVSEGSLIWQSVTTSGGSEVAVDDMSLAEFGQSIRYSSLPNLQELQRRTVDENNNVLTTNFAALAVMVGMEFEPQEETPLILNAIDPTRVLLGGANGLYESFDQGDTIEQVATNVFVSDSTSHPLAYGGYLEGVANLDVVYAGDQLGNVQIRTTAGGTFTSTDPDDTSDQLIRDVRMDVENWQTAFALDEDQVFMTTTTGELWTDITGNLVDLDSQLLSLAFIEGSESALVVGTDVGVFISSTASPGTWFRYGSGLPNVPVWDMEFDIADDVLVVGTLGRGAWILPNASQHVGQVDQYGPQLVTIIPNTGEILRDGDVRTLSPQELVFRFDEGQIIDPVSLGDPATQGSIQIVRAGPGGLFEDGNDIAILPGFIGVGEQSNDVIFRFAESLPDDRYRISIIGAEDGSVTPLINIFGEKFNGGTDRQVDFELDLGPQIVAVVPQPITRDTSGLTQSRDTIDVYFNKDALDLSAAENPQFYQLLATQQTADTVDDVVFNPETVSYDPVANKAVLVFSDDLENLDVAGGGTFRLRVGDSYQLIETSVLATAEDAGSSFITASRELGVLSSKSVVITGGSIEPTQYDTDFLLEWPGGVDEPGHRELPDLWDALPTYWTMGAAELEIEEVASSPEPITLASRICLRPIQGGACIYEISPDEPPYWHVYSDTAKPIGPIGPFNNPTANIAIGSADHFINNGVYPDETFQHPLWPGLEGDEQVLTPWDKVPGTTTLEYNFQDVYSQTPDGNRLLNLITDIQKERAREIFDILSHYLGVQFTETADTGITVATGDLRSVDINFRPGMVSGGAVFDPLQIGRGQIDALVVMSASADWGDSPFGGEWFTTAMHQILHTLGVGHTVDLPPETMTGGSIDEAYGIGSSEAVFPGDHDIVHGQHMYRPDSNDIDLYQFILETDGLFSAETNAERLANPSHLDTVLTLFEEVSQRNEHGMLLTSQRVVAHNDNYYSQDSFLEYELEAGTYYLGVTSTGNIQYDPRIEHSGIGGTTQGDYELRVNFETSPMDYLTDATGTMFDGDADGIAGGIYNFWFNARSETETLFVDKAAVGIAPDGSLANPYTTIREAFVAAESGDIVRIIGNQFENDDAANPLTLRDNQAYEIGRNVFHAALRDGSKMEIPQGVTVMIDAGAMFKLRSANIDVGSSAQGIDRSLGALQVLGIPELPVYFTSYHNEELGADGEPLRSTEPAEGDWGGLVFRNNLDYDAERTVLETEGVFLHYVNHALLSYGGGEVNVNGIPGVFNPIHMLETRPSVSHNTITKSADGAMLGDPNSFADTSFQTNEYTADYDRVGPDIHDNYLVDNTFNGVFVGIRTLAGQSLEELEVTARLDDTDLVHLISENLVISGDSGGLIEEDSFQSRPDARLAIDPGIVVKLDGARIQAEFGTQLIAEGTISRPIIFTSLLDDRYGAGGTFATAEHPVEGEPNPGDWGGLYFGPISDASIDHAVIAYAGGTTTIEGSFARFNPIEIHQSHTRITNTQFHDNSDGVYGDRNGRLPTESSTIFVRGAQPVIAQNRFDRNAGAVVNIDANSMKSSVNPDWGRSTGNAARIQHYADNRGPLLRENQLTDNGLNAVEVRGGTLTTETVWDDTDIVHALFDEIVVANHHTLSGIRLQSNATESLVVKLSGESAGFTASGSPQDIDDRIGGTVQVVGTHSHPVVLTSLADDSFGAGMDSGGRLQRDTNNDGLNDAPLRIDRGTFPAPGDWRSIRLDRYSNDSNVGVVNELESSFGTTNDFNAHPLTAQFLGALAPGEKGVDDNRRLGFQVNGLIRVDDPGDTDVYSFDAEAGTEVWLDIDRSTHALDTVIELIDADGMILATTDDSFVEQNADSMRKRLGVDGRSDDSMPGGLGRTMDRDVWLSKDFGTTNPRDAGMRVALPGPEGQTRTYYVRVRSTVSIGNLDVTQLVDRQVFQIGDATSALTFELDSGPEIRMDAADTTAVRDGDTFVLSDGTTTETFEFNSGPVLVTGDGATLVGGDQFVIGDQSTGNGPVVFEFVDTTLGGTASGSSIPIEFSGSESVEEVVELILTAINGVESLNVTATGYAANDTARISLEGDQLLSTILATIAPSVDNNDFVITALTPDETLENIEIIIVNNIAAGDEAFVSLDRTAATLTIDVDPVATKASTVVAAINAEGTFGATLDLTVETENNGCGFIMDTGVVSSTKVAAGVAVEGHYSLSDPSHVKVPFEETGAAEELFANIAAAANSAFASVTAGAGAVSEMDDLGELSSVFRLTLNGVRTLDLSGVPLLLQMSETDTGVAQGHIPVVFTAADTPGDIAKSLAEAIDQARVEFDLQVTPRRMGDRVVLDGPDAVLSTDGSPLIVVGPTQGVYQLHLRLRELQEYAGSTVRLASIHYATNGVELLGLPTRSPLLGKLAEVENREDFAGPVNDVFENAQDIGNLLDSDQATLLVSGALSDLVADNVDWYKFTLDTEKLDSLYEGVRTWPVTFDIDYADGMERADLSLWVFDADGTLIFRGEGSNLVDDRPGPQEDSDIDNLERGTIGAGDPFIGPVHLLEGCGIIEQVGDSRPDCLAPMTYYVAVTNQHATPTALDQPSFRWEPISSLVRVADDHLGEEQMDLSFIGGLPFPNEEGEYPYSTPMFPELDLHADAFHLGDVVLYVSTDVDLFTVDPFTGMHETDVTSMGPENQLPGTVGTPIYSYGDIAMRNDGQLYTFTSTTQWPGQDKNADAGIYARLDTGDARVFLSEQDDGILSYMVGDDALEVLGDNDPAEEVGGVNFNAMVHEPVPLPDGRRVLAVGNVADLAGDPPNENMLYMFDSTGVAIDHPDAVSDGRARFPTNIVPLAELITGDKGPGGLVTGLAFVEDTLYAVSDAGGLYILEEPFTAGFAPDPPIDEEPSVDDAIVAAGGGPILNFVTLVENDGQAIAFSGLAAGPQNVEEGRFAELLFAIDGDGLLYALDTEGTLQPVFFDGNTSVETGKAGATGLDFSPIDFNLWHTTESRDGDPGHGLEIPPDRSRLEEVEGGVSFYFGLEDPELGGALNPQPGAENFSDLNAEVFGTYDLPGGAHGSLTTSPFSLSGYSSGDAPTLYFNYFLDTESTDNLFDLAQVFAASDGGANWMELGSDLIATDGAWHQTIVDLSFVAGEENVKLRFDFATAGERHIADSLNDFPEVAGLTTGALLRAVPALELNDGDAFVVDEEDLEQAFEFDLGYELLFPNMAGATIQDDPELGGEIFIIEDGAGETVVFEFDKDGGLVTGDVAIAIEDLSTTTQVVESVDLAIASSGLTGVSSFVNGAEITLQGAASITQSDGAAVTLQGANGVDPAATPIPIVPTMSADEVAAAMAAAVDQRYSGLREFRTIDGAALDLAKPFVAVLDMTAEATNDGSGLVTSTGSVGTMALVGTGATIMPSEANNDFRILSTEILPDAIDVIVVNDTAEGDVAIITFDAEECTLTIDVDPTATTANTVIDEINAEGSFTGVLDMSQEASNDGSGLITDVDELDTLRDVFEASVALEGDNNDIMVRSGAWIDPRFDGLEMIVVNENAEGDEALISYDPPAGTITMDVDPTATTANTVLAALNALGGSIRISDGETVFTLEFEDGTTEDGLSVGNTAVLYDPAGSAEDVATAFVDAFNQQNSALATIVVPGENNDILIRATVPGLDLEGMSIIYGSDAGPGDEAIVTVDPDAFALRVDIDPMATTAGTVVDAINDEGSFVAELELSEESANDGSGLIVAPSTVGMTSELIRASLALTGLNNDFRIQSQEIDLELADMEVVFINDMACDDEAIVSLDIAAGTLTIDVDPYATSANTVVAAINDEGTLVAALDLTEDATNDGSGLIVDVGTLGMLEIFSQESVSLLGSNNDFQITAVLADPALVGLDILLVPVAEMGDQAAVTLALMVGTLTIEYDPLATTANTVVEAFLTEGSFAATLDNTLDQENDGTGMVAPLGVVGTLAVPEFNNITVSADGDLVIFAGPVVLLDVEASAVVPVGSVDLPDVLTSVKLDRSLLHIIGHAVVDAGPLPYFNGEGAGCTGVFDIGFGCEHEEALVGIETVVEELEEEDRFFNFRRGQDNRYEGFYIDDLIIGTAERGEMGIGLPDTGFTCVDVTCPAIPGIIDAGPYQLEIRRGTEYGMPLYRAFDTNDRHSQAITLHPDGVLDVFYSQEFTLTDGVNTVVFELVDADVEPVGAGVEIVIPSEDGWGEEDCGADVDFVKDIGDTIADAINDVDELQISASSPNCNFRVDLIGAAGASGIPFTVYGDVVNVSESEQDLLNVELISTEKYDTNHVREQGLTIVDSNTIFHSSEFAIRFDAGTRDNTFNSTPNWPHPGSVATLREINVERLVPSAMIENNLIAYGGQGGIYFGGNSNPAGTPLAAVPFGRIVNNTIFGTTVGAGIMVDENVSPTILNNIVAGLETGIYVHADSSSTVIGTTIYQDNTVDIDLEEPLDQGGAYEATEIFLESDDPLFVDPFNGNFYLESGSRAIDSSVNALPDRPEMTTVRGPLGIPPSPILAPDLDRLGQLRADDPAVAPPPGLGRNVFKDRGALDGDFQGPTAELTAPMDNDAAGRDLDPSRYNVLVLGQTVTEFAVQLLDAGIGVDDTSVTPDTITLLRDSVTLIQTGTTSTDPADYEFSYDPTNNVIRLIALAGVWTEGEYQIDLDNSWSDDEVDPIQDQVGNALTPNQPIGTVEFTVQIDGGSDFGDAPEPPFVTRLPGGASHQTADGFFLGFGVDAEVDGMPSLGADTDALDDGVRFDTRLAVGEVAQITVRASEVGRLDAWLGGAQIFASEPLAAGLNTLTFAVPTGIGAEQGEAYARFRFSSAGGLGPDGAASDGEVEDYLVQIETPSWQNSANRFDVNGDGVVSSQDILLVSNFLYFNGQLNVPEGPGVPPFPVTPPPYYDVNGDEAVTVADGLILAKYLRTILTIAPTEGVMAEGNSGSTPATSFTFLVTRIGDKSVTTSVDYRVTGVGANPVDTADFVNAVFPHGTVVFDVFDETKTITIDVLGDTNIESNENFNVTLSNAIAQTPNPSALGTILNDDITSMMLTSSAGDAANAASAADATTLLANISQALASNDAAQLARRQVAVDQVLTRRLSDDPTEFVDEGSAVRSTRKPAKTLDKFFASLE